MLLYGKKSEIIFELIINVINPSAIIQTPLSTFKSLFPFQFYFHHPHHQTGYPSHFIFLQMKMSFSL